MVFLQRIHSWNAHKEKKKPCVMYHYTHCAFPVNCCYMLKCEVSVWVKRWVESPFLDAHTQICAIWDFWVSHRAASTSWHLHKCPYKVEVEQVYCTAASVWGSAASGPMQELLCVIQETSLNECNVKMCSFFKSTMCFNELVTDMWDDVA